MNEKKIKILLTLMILFLLLAIIGIVLFFQKPSDEWNEVHESNNTSYRIVEIFDMNEFQSVYNSMNLYFEALNGEKNKLLSLLFSNYIKMNHITGQNVTNYTERNYDLYSYNISEIKKYTNSYFSIYYVVGSYRSLLLDEILEENIVYDLVIFDNINNTFSILPLLEKENSFEFWINQYHLTDYNEEISSNQFNEIPSNYIANDFNEAIYYLSDYVDMIKQHCDQAYHYLGTRTKNKYDSFEKFEDLCNFYKNDYHSPSISSYQVLNHDNKSITVIDLYGISYKFLINSVRDYTVEISIK